MKRFFLRFFMVIPLCWIPHTYAASVATLTELMQYAIQNNKDLQAAQYNVDVAQARFVQAGQIPNPTLELANIDDRGLSNEGEYNRSIGFTQEFPIAGRIGRQKNVSRIDIDIAKSEIEQAKRKVLGGLATKFYCMVILDKRLEQLTLLLSVNQQLVKSTQARFKLAEVSQLDINTAQLEYQRILQEKEIAESQRRAIVNSLQVLVGSSLETFAEIDKTLPPFQMLPPLSSLKNQAITQRADFQIGLLKEQRAKADGALAYAQRWGDWKAGIGFLQDKLVVAGAPPQNPDRALIMSLSVPLPLFNKNQGRISEAQHAQTQAQVQLEALQLTIEAQVASEYTQVQSLQTVLGQYNSNVLPLGLENVRLAQHAYNQGQLSLLEVVQVQRQQSDLQNTYLNALDQYLQAWVKLRTALGSDFSTDTEWEPS